MARLNRIGQTVRSCIFCGSKADSDEDLWPKWILERFRAPTFGLMGTVGDDDYIDPKRKTVRLRCVCQKCNNEWMSRLEQDSIPLLSSMAHDLVLPIRLDERTLVAAWAVKTAMLWEYFGPTTRRPYYLDGEKADLRAARRIPENTTVWLARYGGSPLLWSSMADATADPRQPFPDTTARAFVTTIVFGKLCVQVESIRSLMLDVRPLPTTVPVAGPWEDCLVTIWPPTGRETVDWPPKLTLARDVPFHAFRRRWHDMPDEGRDAPALR